MIKRNNSTRRADGWKRCRTRQTTVDHLLWRRRRRRPERPTNEWKRFFFAVGQYVWQPKSSAKWFCCTCAWITSVRRNSADTRIEFESHSTLHHRAEHQVGRGIACLGQTRRQKATLAHWTSLSEALRWKQWTCTAFAAVGKHTGVGGECKQRFCICGSR